MVVITTAGRIAKHFLLNRKMSSPALRSDDNRLATFRQICNEIAEERSYLGKSRILKEFLLKGRDEQGFKGDHLLWIEMLLPAASQRVYNLQNKQMLKLFSRLFGGDQKEMQLDLEQEGDISETLRKSFENSTKLRPQTESSLYLQEVDDFLKDMEQKTKEHEQIDMLRQLCKRTTIDDLKTVVRIMKQDLRINAGPRHILDGLAPGAYTSYQSSRDLSAVVKQFSGSVEMENAECTAKEKKELSPKELKVQVMTPISPMLANPCKSVEEAFKKSPNGLYCEIKYDGERVQIHQRGKEFKFFSRNLKPVMEHKIKRFKDIIPKAFPESGHMVLDSEIILVDTVTGDLLPFGTLGVHKRQEHVRAEVCLFIFDCLQFRGDDLTNLTFRERRKILESNISPIKSYIQLSECHFLKTQHELALMTAKVLKANLEGVVLKDPDGTYRPGKRGWLKIKKDYLFGGKMADTADLVVLGGSYGSGKKGGILSVFLMGCYDHGDKMWKTVTKVHSGLDDATNEEQHENLMKLMVRCDPKNVPHWLLCKKPLLPDYVAKTPATMPVWEITGAEFTKSEAHTADGISIRFPRITRLREDKCANEANDLEYLRKLYESSKSNVNVDLLVEKCNDLEENISIESRCNLMATPEKLQAAKTGGTASVRKRAKRKLSIDEKNESLEKIPKLEHDEQKSETLGKAKDIAKDEEGEGRKRQKDIFTGIVAYMGEEIIGEQYMGMITRHGGAVTKNSKEATFAFHAATQPEMTLESCRTKFRSSCRHLSVQWVRDCVQEKKRVPFPMYAAVFKQRTHS